MAWKRSSVRSRPGPPCFQLLADTPLFSLVAFGSKTLIPRATSSKYGKESKLGTDGVDRLLHALRNLLHVNVSCRCDTGVPEHALDVLHCPLLLPSSFESYPRVGFYLCIRFPLAETLPAKREQLAGTECIRHVKFQENAVSQI